MIAKTMMTAAGLAIAASPLLSSAAAAQSASSLNDYDRGYQAGRADAARADQGRSDDGDIPPSGYAQEGGSYDDDPPPPAGYDATQPPPPPPGYVPDPVYAPDEQTDRRYGTYVENWADRNCVKSNGNTAAGAVIGGLFGALLGSSIAGRHDRGAGALMGGIAGAAGGAAVGNAQDNATSPGCPPGYVVRRGATSFQYDGWANSDYVYAAPGWYRPWVMVEGRWAYRPYPYHGWYYRHGWNRGGWHGGYGRGWRRRW